MLTYFFGGYSAEKTIAANKFLQQLTGRPDVNMENLQGNANKAALDIFLKYSDEKGVLQGKGFSDGIFKDKEFQPRGQAKVNVLGLKVLLSAGLENEVVFKFQELNPDISINEAGKASRFIAENIITICKNDKTEILSAILTAFLKNSITEDNATALLSFLNTELINQKMSTFVKLKHIVNRSNVHEDQRNLAIGTILKNVDHFVPALKKAVEEKSLNKRFANKILEAFEKPKIPSEITPEDVAREIYDAGKSLPEDYSGTTDFQTQGKDHESAKEFLIEYLNASGASVEIVSPPPKRQDIVDTGQPLNPSVFSVQITNGVNGDIQRDGISTDDRISIYVGAGQFNLSEEIVPKPVPRGQAWAHYQNDPTQGPQAQLAFGPTQVETINSANRYNGLLPALSNNTFRSVVHGYFMPTPYHVRKGIIHELDKNGHKVEYPLIGNRPINGIKTVYLMIMAAPAFGMYAPKDQALRLEPEDQEKIEYFCALNSFRAQFHAAIELAKTTGKPIDLKTCAVGLGVFGNNPKTVAAAFRAGALEFQDELAKNHVRVLMQIFKSPSPRLNEGPFEETAAYKFMEDCFGKQEPEKIVPLDANSSHLLEEIKSAYQQQMALTQRQLKTFNELDDQLKISAFYEFAALSKYQLRSPAHCAKLIIYYRAFLEKRIDFIQFSLLADSLNIPLAGIRNAKDFAFLTMKTNRTVDDLHRQRQYYFPSHPNAKYSNREALFGDFVNYIQPYIRGQAGSQYVLELFKSFLTGKIGKVEFFKAINQDYNLSPDVKQRAKLFMEEIGYGLKAIRFKGGSEASPPVFYQNMQPSTQKCEFRTIRDPGGVANIATALYAEAPIDQKPNWAIGVAGNSGAPGGEILHNPTLLEQRLNDKTQEETAWANATFSTFQNLRQEFYEDTIKNVWGLIDSGNTNLETIQGEDFVHTESIEPYNEAYVVDDCQISAVAALEGNAARKVLVDHTLGFVPSCPASFVFGNSANANAARSKFGATSRTLNLHAQNSYEHFCLCIESTVRAMLDAALLYGKRDVLIPKLSCGIYVRPEYKDDINARFPDIVNKVLKEVVAGTNTREMYFDRVIIADIAPEVPLQRVNTYGVPLPYGQAQG